MPDTRRACKAFWRGGDQDGQRRNAFQNEKFFHFEMH
jgi:hypothetical protein